MGFFSRLFGTDGASVIRKNQPMVDKILALESNFAALSNEQLRAKTEEWKVRLAGKSIDEQKKILDTILPEAFAVVVATARKLQGTKYTLKGAEATWDMVPFAVQLHGGMVLHQNKVAEMKTGEGKTLVAVLPAYLNALAGRGVFIVTVNDYLATRDAEWMGPLYAALGVSVGVVLHGQSFAEKKAAYAADITYGTNNEMGFDYLRDNMAQSIDQVVQREPLLAIVDEVDSILIDEARTPLIISAPDEDSSTMYAQFARIAPQLKEDTDYNVDEKAKAVSLTDAGIDRVEKMLGVTDIYSQEGIKTVHHLEQALKAEVVYHLDKDYVVKDGQVLIVDPFTGRVMPGRRFSEGLHQALEAKEGVPVQQESKTLATITFQNYFRMFPKLAGMTGTALTQAEEFQTVYNLEVVVVPTHKPTVRKDFPDRIYKNEQAKFTAVVEEIKKRHATGQPLLVGTVAIEKSEALSHMLTRAGIAHEVLNAKQHEREAQIVANAGQKGVVTIATNMAGRGTDIKLGAGVVALGGLHIIGTERHEARRIDNQLRGRAGRQGDPGSTQFFISLDDDVMRMFGSDRLKSVMNTLKIPDDQPIESGLVSKQIEGAQKRVEGHNFDIRTHVLQYDSVIATQRKAIYATRRELLAQTEKDLPALLERLHESVDEEVGSVLALHTAAEMPGSWDVEEIVEVANTLAPMPKDLHSQLLALRDAHTNPDTAREHLSKKVITTLRASLDKALAMLPNGHTANIIRLVFLRAIDVHWVEHLEDIEYLRTGIGLRGYGQRDPLVEYKREAKLYFDRLLGTIRHDVVTTVFKALRAAHERPQVVAATPAPALDPNRLRYAGGDTSATEQPAKKSDRESIGRNDPCWCGSGKKFKKCHGK